MKKGWKRFWIICAATAGVGLVLCISGIVMGATLESVDRYSPDWISINETKTYSVTEEADHEENATLTNKKTTFYDVRKLDIEACALELELAASDSTEDEVRVEIAEGEEFVRCRLEGSELSVEVSDSWKASDDIPQVTIYIPKAHFGEIDIDVDAGYVYIETLTSVGSLGLNVGAGEIDVDNFIADEVEISCGAGSIHASGTCNGNVDIECGAGEVYFITNGSKEAYNYEIECGIGDIMIDGDSFSGIGEKEIRSHDAAKEMSIECGIGSVTVDFIK